MAKEKKGAWQKLKGWFSSSAKDEDIEQSLHKWGFNLHKSSALKQRLSAQRILYLVIKAPLKEAEPAAKIHKIRHKHDIMNAVVGLTAGPYAGAGDDQRYDRMFEGWQQIYSDGTWLIDGLSNYYLRNDNKPKISEEKIRAIITMASDKEKKLTKDSVDLIITQVMAKQKEENTQSHELIEYKDIAIDSMIQMTYEVLQMHFWKYGFMVINKCFKDRHVSPETIALIQNMMPQKGNTMFGYEDGMQPQIQVTH